MATPSRKTDDLTLIGLNSVGLSLGGIARRIGVHHTTVTHRLKVLNIEPADTRRAFMEDIYSSLSVAQQQWLVDQLGPGQTVKDFIRSLLVKEFVGRKA